MSDYKMTPDEEATLRTEEREFAYFAGQKQGLMTERERIIKLLEQLKEPDMKFHKFETLVNVNRIIALIEGKED
jgi:hypothetical protein